MGEWTEYLVFDTEKWSAAVNSVVSESLKIWLEFIDHMKWFSRETALCWVSYGRGMQLQEWV